MFMYSVPVLLLQGCCLTGARSPEAPTICLLVTKMSNQEPKQVFKMHDSLAHFW